jgi:membrane protein YqaA with SNARE-associated domain
LDKKPSTAETGVTDELIRDEVQAHGLARRFAVVRRFYVWILGWAETRHAGKAMAIHAFIEGLAIPVPADLLLIPLCLGSPKRSFWWSFVCTFWSIVGGTTAMLLATPIGEAPVRAAIDWLHPGIGTWLFEGLREPGRGFWMVAITALTLPYNAASWVAGFSGLPLWQFLLASVIFRPIRFFVVGGAIYSFGMPAKRFIEKYFELALVLVLLGIIGVLVALHYFKKMLGG